MVPIHSRLAERKGSNMKAPNSKHQAPKKLQISNFKQFYRTRCFGAWNLVFLWSLVLGAWCFSAHAVGTNTVLSTWIAAQTNIHTWSADVVQTRTLKSLAKPLTAYGHVWFEAPNRFRWELTNPVPSIAVRGPEEMLII